MRQRGEGFSFCPLYAHQKGNMSLLLWEADRFPWLHSKHRPSRCQALSEAGQRLKVSDQDAVALRTEVQRLSAALAEAEAQRHAWSSDAERMNRELAQYKEEVSCPPHKSWTGHC